MPQPSSTTFWDLMDRWDVPNDQALELVGYEGKLPTTDRRPRFKLSTEQARIVATLLEVDSALATAGLKPSWLHKRSGKRSRSPLDLMRAGATDEVLRSLTQTALLASVQKKGRWFSTLRQCSTDPRSAGLGSEWSRQSLRFLLPVYVRYIEEDADEHRHQ
jgi:hypothetical protein